jgi:hypothetical protein
MTGKAALRQHGANAILKEILLLTAIILRLSG